MLEVKKETFLPLILLQQYHTVPLVHSLFLGSPATNIH